MPPEPEPNLARLLLLQHQLWVVAAPVGALHAYWDIISDIDDFSKGRPTVVQHTCDEWIAVCEDLLRLA